MILDIPCLPGTYGLFLDLPDPVDLRIGRLGKYKFPAGKYVYLGSAWGPGGLQARLGRHVRGPDRLHWHIDWLRKEAEPVMIFYSTFPGRLECTWSQALACMPGAFVPAANFGASDCRAGCPAHLVGFPPDFSYRTIAEGLESLGAGYVVFST